MDNKIKIARNQDATEAILNAAMYSFVGAMIYRKWVPSEKHFVRKRYKIIPIDCGYTSRKNAVLFAQDYENNKQIKQFIINQIQRFESLKQKVKPAFPIQVERIRSMFGIGKIKQQEENQPDVVSNMRIAKQLIKIATELQQFSGAQANLYRDEKKVSISESKEKVLNKYNRRK